MVSIVNDSLCFTVALLFIHLLCIIGQTIIWIDEYNVGQNNNMHGVFGQQGVFGVLLCKRFIRIFQELGR